MVLSVGHADENTVHPDPSASCQWRYIMQDALTSLLDSPVAIWSEVSAHIIETADLPDPHGQFGIDDESVKDSIQSLLDTGDELICIIWDYPNMPPAKISIERAAGIAGYIEGRLHALGFTDLEVTFTRADHDTNWVISLPAVSDATQQVEMKELYTLAE